MIIEKKYIRFWFLVGILFALFIIGSSTMHASAAKWPGNNFADNSELMLTLSVNENHPDPSGSSVVFALYSTSSGPKTITINGYRNGNPTCGEKGYARVYSADYSFKEFKKGNCSSKDLVVTQTGTKVFQKWDDPDQSYTYYEYRIYASLYGWKDNDTQANDARFAFTVDSNDGVFYQKQGTLGTSSLPLSSNRGDVYLNNIKIPVGSCNESKLFTFITYDSDNAADYWAQTNYPDYSNFRFLKFSLEYNTGFLRANLPKVSSSGLDWKNTGTDVYYPDDRPYAPAKRPRGYISFNIPKLNNDNRSYLVLKDLGGNNFINLWVPDGADSGFGCPKKIIKPPSPGEHNWAINAQTVASSPTVLVGQPAWFNHQLRPATYGGWTSDSYTTTNVDVDVYRNGVNSDATLMDLNAFDYIDKTEKTIVDTSRPGRYCEKMVFPHGVLGTRKDVNYNNSGFTYRWAFFPGRALPNGSVLAGGYDNWWLTSTNRDQYDSTKSYNQWWSFHTHSAGESHGWENYNSLGYYQWRGKEIEASHMWEYNGFPASFPYTSNEACIEVVEPELSVTPPLDYEKGSGDKTITHTLTIPGSPNCPAIAVNWRIEGVGDTSNALDYSQNATTSFAGGTDCTKNIPITISGSQLDRLSVPFQLNYRTIVLGYPDAKGSLAIFEVPFARFYGNDIYATGTASSVGKIEFNSYTNNPDHTYDGRGSVAQYAALAVNPTNKIDSAAFRLNAAVKPNAPNGLDPDTTSYLSNTSATKVYNDVVNKIPKNCILNWAGGSLTGFNGCYKNTNDVTVNLTTTSSKATVSARNVTIAEDLNNNSFDPTAEVGATVYKHIEYNLPPWNVPGAYAVNLTERSYTTADLAALGVSNNDISSLRVNGNFRITLYDGDNFTGNSLVLVGSNNNLLNNPFNATDNWNDKTSSIRVEKTTVPNVQSAGVLLIVADNIYINKDVQRIDAILVAKNAIYTCANGTTPVTQANLDNDCRKTLTINGSLSAQTIKFQRVGGSRYLAKGVNDDAEGGTWNCNDFRGIKQCGARGGISNESGKTAEIINFPAYLYWASPYLLDESTSGGTNEAMFTAPPRL